MWQNDLPSVILRLLIAIFSAFIFVLTCFVTYSPERLLAQAFLVALFIDCFRPFLRTVDNVAMRTVSAIAYFAPRVVLFAFVCSWFFTNDVFSQAMAHEGWRLVSSVIFAGFMTFIVTAAALMTLANIALAVWTNAFGPRTGEGIG